MVKDIWRLMNFPIIFQNKQLQISLFINAYYFLKHELTYFKSKYQIEIKLTKLNYKYLKFQSSTFHLINNFLIHQKFIERIDCSFFPDMSTAKKPMRRARQKKQLMDEEDLQKQQQVQKAIKEGRSKLEPNDIFDTGKLDKNYFVRQENNTFHNEAEVSNFDEEAQTKAQSKQVSGKNQSQQLDKKNTTGRRRDVRRRPKNQNIFDEEDQKEKQQNHNQVTQLQPTNDNYPQRKPFIDQNKKEKEKKQIKQKPDIIEKQSEISSEKEQQTSKEEGNQVSDEEEQEEERDDFDDVIKNEADKSQQEEKVYILHKEFAKLPKEDRKDFYYQTITPNHVGCAYFKRFSSGLSEIYQLCGQDHRALLFCQNQRGCIGANYYISMTKEMDKNSPSYLGKLRGNASGSIYHLYDDGIQPKNQINRSDWRVSMAAIEYENNFMGMNGPRKLKATTPSAKLLEDADTFKLSEEETLLSFQAPIISQFRNKTPKWNDKLKSYALNFGGRVKMASIKNFVLIEDEYSIEDEDDADNVIVFGKVDENTFSLEYRYPLSLFQAFGIVMSEFDFKINCE